MRRGALALAAIGVLAVGVFAGHWWGTRGRPDASVAVPPSSASTPPVPAGRTILYYRNPMGLPDTSPVPKKDPMGMDYLPVYADEAQEASGNAIRISVDKMQKLGVRSEAAAMRALGRTIKAAGRIEIDERRVFAIAPKFEGWVEQLFVNATGQPVVKGQPLFEAYSPELVSAQREYAIATAAAKSLEGADAVPQDSMKRLAESSLARLKNWDISEDQIRSLAQSGQSRRTLTFDSPVSGFVIEKKAVQGMRFTPGDTLYRVADLSSVWVIADVYEQDIASVRLGAKATLTVAAYPGKVYQGRIAYVYPTLAPETRTVPVRIEIANPGYLLKPAMFAQVEVPAGGSGKVLTVPASAVIDGGIRRTVLIQRAEGRFEPREVKTGSRTEDYVEIIEGVNAGEEVVVAANFLIDAESNLKAAIGAFTATANAAPAAHAGAPAAGGANAPPSPPRPASVGHRAQGTIKAIDAAAGTLSIAHGPVASLQWPAMTMDFKVANATLLTGLAPGAAIAFEFVERSPGEWVITRVTGDAAAPGREPRSAAHQGH